MMTNILYTIQKQRLADFIYNEIPDNHLKHVEAPNRL